ncbi:MAG: hypothetical protein OEV64_04525 [Desulfobulbaceae bacterium]|nr:hypothetical protein [Desulfobulbaceae bacterium]
MAPARMMQFVDQHIRNCTVCQEDVLLAAEIEKIRGFVLPESKIPKAIREQGDDDDSPEPSYRFDRDDDDEDESDDNEDDEDEDNDDDEDEDDIDDDDEDDEI